MTILPLPYLGSTRWAAEFLLGETLIDMGENYVKQSCRNRCRILSTGGVMSLTVNVVKGGSIHKRPMKDMRIDYSKRWQHEHWISILSAYKSSPYFDYFGELFAPFYRQRYEFLADFNLRQTELLVKLLGVGKEPAVSERYVIPAEGDRDLRGYDFLKTATRENAFDTKTDQPDDFVAEPYYQVFSEKFPFAGELSLLDLFFCEGPEGTVANLRKSLKR